MFDYRPPWAAAMALQATRKTHLRKGWSAGLGHHPWCQPSQNIKSAIETAWVSVDDIRNREIHDTASKTNTCENCCRMWMNAYTKGNDE